MGGFRARDADRDRAVDLIEAAYVDGQLGDHDRELRVSRALSAETVGELESLTRDLQRPAAPPPPPSAPVGPSGQSPRRWVSGLVATFVVLIGLVVAGVTGIVALFSASGDPVSTGPVVVVDTDGTTAAPPGEVVDVETPTFAMTAPDVRAFLRAYERQFGTLDAWDVSFYPGRVAVEVPVRGSRPRSESWSWTGAWEQTSPARAAGPANPGLVDLGRIRPERLLANVRRAERTLDVQGGAFTHAVLWSWDEVGPTLNIHVGNDYGEGGYLRTTLAGEVVRAFPYGG